MLTVTPIGITDAGRICRKEFTHPPIPAMAYFCLVSFGSAQDFSQMALREIKLHVMADTIIYDLKLFYTQSITCPNCGWQGVGSDTIIIDMYGIGDARQVNCPNCDNFLGSLPRAEEPRPETPDELSDQIG